MNASRGGFDPTSAKDPAVVCIRSAVAMLSLIRTGIPCSGPRGPFSFRSLSKASAISSASGFISITLLTLGPLLSIAAIRARYFSAIECAVYFPDFIPSCNSPIVISSNSNAGTSAATSLPRAAANTGCKTGPAAAATPPSKLACKNVRRPGVPPAPLGRLTSPDFAPPTVALPNLPSVSFFMFIPPASLPRTKSTDSTLNSSLFPSKIPLSLGFTPRNTQQENIFPRAQAPLQFFLRGVPP